MAAIASMVLVMEQVLKFKFCDPNCSGLNPDRIFLKEYVHAHLESGEICHLALLF